MDAFNHSDEVLRSAIGSYDGNANERLLLATQESHLNCTEVRREKNCRSATRNKKTNKIGLRVHLLFLKKNAICFDWLGLQVLPSFYENIKPFQTEMQKDVGRQGNAEATRTKDYSSRL